MTWKRVADLRSPQQFHAISLNKGILPHNHTTMTIIKARNKHWYITGRYQLSQKWLHSTKILCRIISCVSLCLFQLWNISSVFPWLHIFNTFEDFRPIILQKDIQKCVCCYHRIRLDACLVPFSSFVIQMILIYPITHNVHFITTNDGVD